MNQEAYFRPFREKTVGHDQFYYTPYGRQRMIYADWIASGRLYYPIEQTIIHEIGPFIGNTHTQASETGKLMTTAYRLSHEKIKQHVNAGPDDVILTTGFGMTGAVVKFQRILGFKAGLNGLNSFETEQRERPVVFITHMEHHSNHTTWYETVAEVVVIKPGKDLTLDLNHLEDALKKYKNAKTLIGSFTACSNVTGIRTPIHEMASLIHRYGGKIFADYAASAPYDPIDMHPANPEESLDAIFFSPHKFLGGPGSSGVLIFNSSLYKNSVPDQPGGGTVEWTNPWGEYKFIDNIELREDGGTPGFLQAMRSAMSLDLKDRMGTWLIHEQEDFLLRKALGGLCDIPGVHILGVQTPDRLGVISFYMDSIHYNLAVALLSDRFGIQVRGGCACAGTYGHYLMDVSYERSRKITERISSGDLSEKPGWVRLSLHPTMTVAEVEYMLDAVKEISINHRRWGSDYDYDRHTNEFSLKQASPKMPDLERWFSLNTPSKETGRRFSRHIRHFLLSD